jgi:hypothetical protein
MTDLLVRGQWNIPVQSRDPQRRRSTMWIAFAGALAYCSWPLAYLVNPSLAGNALASSFEGHSQPFSWLFILLDGIAGFCAAIVCIRELRPLYGRPRPGRALVYALLGYAMFGLATAIDAVVPLNCGSRSIQACARQVWPLTPDDVLTGVALLALLAAAVTVIVQMNHRPTVRSSAVPATTIIITVIVWSALGVMVLGSTSATLAALAQYAFLTLTSLLAFFVPLGATSLRRRSTASVSSTPKGASMRPKGLAQQQDGMADLLLERKEYVGTAGDEVERSRGRTSQQSNRFCRPDPRRPGSPLPSRSAATSCSMPVAQHQVDGRR